MDVTVGHCQGISSKTSTGQCCLRFAPRNCAVDIQVGLDVGFDGRNGAGLAFAAPDREVRCMRPEMSPETPAYISTAPRCAIDVRS